MKIGYCAYRYRYGPHEIFTYHDTVIVDKWIMDRDDYLPRPILMRVRNGGYQTVSTKTHINSIIMPYGWRVYQMKGAWYLDYFNGGWHIPFVDDIVIWNNGQYTLPNA